MSDADTLELELTSNPDVLPEARQTLRQWALDHGWTEDQAAEIALAVDEALSNVIRHGYDCDASCAIQVNVHAIDEPDAGEGLEIRVRDFGRQIDPDLIRGRDLDDVRPGGLGVHLIRAMMSTVRYTPAEGGGMLLTMRKFRNHSAGTGHAPDEAS
ncbi:MAG: ATP-binding protein [Phycisphaerae bacterium]|jgi:anti-sigma regulatory factor (Ser/Thr protein kinase)